MDGSENRRTVGQFFQFVLIGASNTLIDYLVFLLLNGVFGWYYAAKIVGFALGTGNSYLWNTVWTFRRERRRDAREMLTFLGVNLVVLGLSLGLMWLLRDAVGITDERVFTVAPWGEPWLTADRLCTAVATGICVIVNFALNKLVVFRRKPKEHAPQNVE